jgi:hypothetical protein
MRIRKALQAIVLVCAITSLWACSASADWDMNSGIQTMYKFNSDGTANESTVPLGFTYRPDVVMDGGTIRASRIPIFAAYNFGVSDGSPASQWFGAGWSFQTWEGYELIGEANIVLEGSSNEKLVGGMMGMRAIATIGGQPFLVRLLGGWVGAPALSVSINFTSGPAPEKNKVKGTIKDWQ